MNDEDNFYNQEVEFKNYISDLKQSIDNLSTNNIISSTYDYNNCKDNLNNYLMIKDELITLYNYHTLVYFKKKISGQPIFPSDTIETLAKLSLILKSLRVYDVQLKSSFKARGQTVSKSSNAPKFDDFNANDNEEQIHENQSSTNEKYMPGNVAVDLEGNSKKSRIKKIKNNIIFDELKTLDDNEPEEEDIYGEAMNLDKKGRVLSSDMGIERMDTDYEQFSRYLGSNQIISGMGDNLKRKRSDQDEDDHFEDNFLMDGNSPNQNRRGSNIEGNEKKGGNGLFKNDHFKKKKKGKKGK